MRLTGWGWGIIRTGGWSNPPEKTESTRQAEATAKTEYKIIPSLTLQELRTYWEAGLLPYLLEVAEEGEAGEDSGATEQERLLKAEPEVAREGDPVPAHWTW